MIEAACRHGGYSSAARALSISHSAISQQVSRLERTLGFPLFERVGGRLRPTEMGRELAAIYARAAQSLDRLVARAGGEGPAPVVISAPAAWGRCWFRHRVRSLHGLSPNITIQLRPRGESPDFSRISAAVTGSDQFEDGYRREWLFNETLTPICSPTLLPQHGLRSPADVLAAPLLVHDEAAWRAWFARHDLSLDDAACLIHLDDLDLALDAALESQGVALACATLMQRDVAQGRLIIPIDDALDTGRRVHLVWPQDAVEAVEIQGFAEWLGAELRNSPQPVLREAIMTAA
ncbi:MAG: hypothetical protein BGN86_10180 [Caulobacterales bacterium 68-7]|nr:MAG: hypothetical protein BGN86_10180 [Caulobacterales bacterium 68-7]